MDDSIYKACSHFFWGWYWGTEYDEDTPKEDPIIYTKDHIIGSHSDGGWNDFLVPKEMIQAEWLEDLDKVNLFDTGDNFTHYFLMPTNAEYDHVIVNIKFLDYYCYGIDSDG